MGRTGTSFQQDANREAKEEAVQSNRSANAAWPAIRTIWMKRLAAFLIALMLGLSFFAVTSFDQHFTSDAYASIRSVDEDAAPDDQKEDESAKSGESESIQEDETPMSSGLGGGEPVSNDMGIAEIAIVGIIAVGAFFFVLMRKLNTNIKDMDSMFK